MGNKNRKADYFGGYNILGEKYKNRKADYFRGYNILGNETVRDFGLLVNNYIKIGQQYAIARKKTYRLLGYSNIKKSVKKYFYTVKPLIDTATFGIFLQFGLPNIKKYIDSLEKVSRKVSQSD